MQRFENRVVLIIGGNSGIGLATAKLFADEGAKLVIAGRDVEAGNAAVGSLPSSSEARFVKTDVRVTDSVAQLVDETVKVFGRIDVAFNNAGWESAMLPLADTSETDWHKMIDIKLNGVWRGMKYQLPQMVKQGGGVIINMSGNWGLVGAANFSAYCAAAHGVMGVTKAAALEYISAGIRVNAVCPGAVDTAIFDRIVGMSEEIKKAVGEGFAIGRICTPEEVAKTVVFLASDDASYINGVGLVMDGGS